MRINAFVSAGLFGLATATDAASWDSSTKSRTNVIYRRQAPHNSAVRIGPKQPFHPMPVSTPRTKECDVKGGSGADDSANILDAIKQCNNGGRVIFARGTKYMVGRAMDLSTLSHIDLGMHALHSLRPRMPDVKKAAG